MNETAKTGAKVAVGEGRVPTVGLFLIGLAMFFLLWAALSPPLRRMATAGYGVVGTEVRAGHEIVVREIARELSLPPELLVAIAEVESGFDENAVSSKGAIGIMQVLPDTAIEIAVESKLGPRHLKDVRDNALIGGLYFKKLMARYKDDLALALAAYNAGPSKVDQWAKWGRDMDGAGVVKKYAYRETRLYVKKVLAKSGLPAQPPVALPDVPSNTQYSASAATTANVPAQAAAMSPSNSLPPPPAP